jgi:hypothetical protein
MAMVKVTVSGLQRCVERGSSAERPSRLDTQ